MSAHLQPMKTSRGFTHLPAIPGAYGGEVTTYESSAASSPHVWLNVIVPMDTNNPKEGQNVEATLHLSLDNAAKLSEQLSWLIVNHYQIKEST